MPQTIENKRSRRFLIAKISPPAARRPQSAQIFRAILLTLLLAFICGAAQARFRQPNAEYQARRAKLLAQVDGPVVIFGYTGHEDASEVAVFYQEPYFYYLTGHDEPGAAVLLIPDPPAGKSDALK